MSRRIRAHLRSNVVGYIALFLALTTGSAYALAGHNTVFSDDIVNGEVKGGDLAADSVKTDKIKDGEVGVADIGPNAVDDEELAPVNGDENIVDETLTTFDIQSNAIQTDEIQDATVGKADIGAGAVGASEVGDGIINRLDPTPTTIPGGTAENGSYSIGTSVALCNAGEELIGGTGQWTPDDNASGDLELFIGEVRLNQTAEEVTVDGGNDSGADHDLTAVAVCLQV